MPSRTPKGSELPVIQGDSADRNVPPPSMQAMTRWTGADVWADVSRVYSEFTTFQIDLGEAQVDSGTIFPIARIRMPPQAAKMLSGALRSAVLAWEEQYGDIDLERAGQILMNHDADDNGERPNE